MDSSDIDALRTALSWLAEGWHPKLGTVVRTWGSSPRPVGSLVVIRDDGLVAGSISGGCAEDDLIERVRQGAVAIDRPELVRYGVTREQAQRFGLPCGGSLEVVVEPLTDTRWLQPLLEEVAAHRIVRRTLDLPTGRCSIGTGTQGDTLSFDGTTLRTVHGPRWRLLVIGAGQLTRYLVPMAQALDYRVIVCDPRTEYTDSWPQDGSELTRDMPDDAVHALKPDGHLAVVALTHDPKLDDLALLEALKSPAFYVGALGSRANSARRRERLALFDLSAEEIDRLHAPIGLAIGSRTPPEIAVAILAEITAVRHGASLPTLRDRPAPAMPRSEDLSLGCFAS